MFGNKHCSPIMNMGLLYTSGPITGPYTCCPVIFLVKHPRKDQGNIHERSRKFLGINPVKTGLLVVCDSCDLLQFLTQPRITTTFESCILDILESKRSLTIVLDILDDISYMLSVDFCFL